MEWILLANQECRIGYKNSHSRVSRCLASIRKLGNLRSSKGLRSFKPLKETNLFIFIILAGDIKMNPGFNVAYAKSTVKHRIDSMNLRNVKNASILHVAMQNLARWRSLTFVLSNSKWRLAKLYLQLQSISRPQHLIRRLWCTKVKVETS